MRYDVSIEINAPREQVVDLFMDERRFREWQPDLIEYFPTSKKRGIEGATAVLRVRMGNSDMEMIETVDGGVLPHTHSVIYRAKGVWNRVDSQFHVRDGGGATEWICTSEFRCQGMMRLVMFCMPWLFKKETRKHLERFKAFVEAAN